MNTINNIVKCFADKFIFYSGICYMFVCLFGFNVALKHLRSYHDGACL